MFLSSLLNRERMKARLSGISNLFKFETSANMNPVLDRCSPKKERGRRTLRGNRRGAKKELVILWEGKTLTRTGPRGP